MSWSRAGAAALLGTLPAALLYAWVGASATATLHGALAFALVLPVAGAYYLLGRWLRLRLR